MQLTLTNFDQHFVKIAVTNIILGMKNGLFIANSGLEGVKIDHKYTWNNLKQFPTNVELTWLVKYGIGIVVKHEILRCYCLRWKNTYIAMKFVRYSYASRKVVTLTHCDL